MGTGPLGFVGVCLCYAVVAVLLWAPGFLLASIALRFFPRLLPYRVIVAFAASCLLGYLAFWVYVVDSPAGLVFSVAASLAGLVGLARSSSRRALFQSRPVHLAFLVGLFYLSSHYLSGSGEALALPQYRYFETMQPLDNILPFCFADLLYQHDPMIHIGNPVLGWHFSDRPPLQAAITLLFWYLKGPFDRGVYYQCVGTLLQTSWVIAFCALARPLGWSSRQTAYVTGVTIFSGFVFYNCVYVWPKMLAGALFLFGLVPVLTSLQERRRLSGAEAVLCAVAWALSLLAHAGVAFSGLGLALVGAFWARRLCGVREALLAAAVLAAMQVPWLAYERFVDPNAARLAKWHLAGVRDIDERPFLTVLRSSYIRITPEQWAQGRVQNLQSLFGNSRLDDLAEEALKGWLAGKNRVLGPSDRSGLVNPYRLRTDLPSVATILRIEEREYVFRALGLLNLGWLGLLIGLWRRDRNDSSGNVTRLLMLNLVTLAAWCLIEFTPGYAITAHASYAMMLLLFLLAGWGLWHLGAFLRTTVAAAQALIETVLWGAFLPGSGLAELEKSSQEIHTLPLLMAIGLGAWLFVGLVWPGTMARWFDRPAQDPGTASPPAGGAEKELLAPVRAMT